MSTPGDRFSQGLQALKNDLLRPEGPMITSMSNYRFAILPYLPQDEFRVRKEVRECSDQLRARGWNVLELSAQKLLMNRLKRLESQEPEFRQSWIAREKRLCAKNKRERSLEYTLKNLEDLVSGQDGLAQDAIEQIHRFAEEYKVDTEKTLIWITRMGTLYPFFRSSSLLKHLDGNTKRIPVVVLYPGTRAENIGLSFMGQTAIDRDYRPRIYP